MGVEFFSFMEVLYEVAGQTKSCGEKETAEIAQREKSGKTSKERVQNRRRIEYWDWCSKFL